MYFLVSEFPLCYFYSLSVLFSSFFLPFFIFCLSFCVILLFPIASSFYSFLFNLSLLFLFPNAFLKILFSFFLLLRFFLIWDFLPSDIHLKIFKFQARCLNRKIVNLFQVTRCKPRNCKRCVVANT